MQVRHMALQNQFALRKFILGLTIFILSVIFFALAEYHIFISSIVVVAVAIMSRQTYLQLNEVVGFFQLNPEVTVTGQWDLTGRIGRVGRDVSGSTQPAGAGGRPAVPLHAAPAIPKRRSCVGLFGMGEMLAHQSSGSRESAKRRRKAGDQKHPSKQPSAAWQVRWAAFRERLHHHGSRKGSAWAAVHNWAQPHSVIQDMVTSEKQHQEEQQPSLVAEQLIFRHEKMAAACTGTNSFSPVPVRRSTLMRRGSMRDPGAHPGAAWLQNSGRSDRESNGGHGRHSGGDGGGGDGGGGVGVVYTAEDSSAVYSEPPRMMLGLPPFLDKLVSDFGSSVCAREQSARSEEGGLGSRDVGGACGNDRGRVPTQHERARDGAMRVPTQHERSQPNYGDGVCNPSVPPMNFWTPRRDAISTPRSLERRQPPSTSSVDDWRRASAVEGNFLAQASEVLDNIKEQAEGAIETLIDRIGLNGVPWEPRGSSPRDLSRLVTSDTNGTRTHAAALPSPSPSARYGPPVSARTAPLPDAVRAAEQWTANKPDTIGGPQRSISPSSSL
jgi:uncharacterized membrane protein YgcG